MDREGLLFVSVYLCLGYTTLAPRALYLVWCNAAMMPPLGKTATWRPCNIENIVVVTIATLLATS